MLLCSFAVSAFPLSFQFSMVHPTFVVCFVFCVCCLLGNYIKINSVFVVYTNVTSKKFRRKLFCHLLFRVRKRRSQSVLPGRFSVLKSCLLWVPQCICLGSYKVCSKKLLCWGRPRPEFQKLAVEKDIHHLQDLYTCQ